MHVVFLTSDLMISSQLSGDNVQVAESAEQLLKLAAELPAEWVILDLTSPACDPATLVPKLRQLPNVSKILAFGPHVHQATLAAAKAANCDEVLSRGQFHRDLPQILMASKAEG